jgi:ABC-type uncharacterized transport system auxiliary subunit
MLLAITLTCVVTACALIRPPSPATVLRLTSAPSIPAWPAGLAIGEVDVDAVSAMRGNRVIVADGPLLLQYEGVRWVDAPAVMLLELARRPAAQQDGTRAKLDLHLQAFELRVSAHAPLQAVVAVHGALHCLEPGASFALDRVESAVTVEAREPRAIAEAFSAATGSALSSVVLASADAMRGCAKLPP